MSGRSDHLLVDIVGITILAVLCGADDFVAVATIAKFRQEWLGQFFELPAGVPSHDTFARVLGLLDPKPFSAALVNWTAALQTALAGRTVAIDGEDGAGFGESVEGHAGLAPGQCVGDGGGVVAGAGDQGNRMSVPRIVRMIA